MVLRHLVHFDHVRVVNAAHDLSLFEKHGAKRRVSGQLGQHGFDGDEALFPADGRAFSRDPHAGHAAATEPNQQLVSAERRARLQFRGHPITLSMYARRLRIRGFALRFMPRNV